jgi:hypothetical protein
MQSYRNPHWTRHRAISSQSTEVAHVRLKSQALVVMQLRHASATSGWTPYANAPHVSPQASAHYAATHAASADPLGDMPKGCSLSHRARHVGSPAHWPTHDSYGAQVASDSHASDWLQQLV